MTRLERRRLWLDRRLAEADAVIYALINGDDTAQEWPPLDIKERWIQEACRRHVQRRTGRKERL